MNRDNYSLTQRMLFDRPTEQPAEPIYNHVTLSLSDETLLPFVLFNE